MTTSLPKSSTIDLNEEKIPEHNFHYPNTERKTPHRKKIQNNNKHLITCQKICIKYLLIALSNQKSCRQPKELSAASSFMLLKADSNGNKDKDRAQNKEETLHLNLEFCPFCPFDSSNPQHTNQAGGNWREGIHETGTQLISQDGDLP